MIQPIHKVSDVVREFMNGSWRTKLERWTSPAGKGHTIAHAEMNVRDALIVLLSSIVDRIEGEKIKRSPKGCYLKGDDGKTYIMDCEYGNCEHAGFNAAIDRAITIIKSSME